MSHYRDTLLIAVLNSVTSIFAGFVIFSIVGFMSVSTGKEVEDVVSQGKSQSNYERINIIIKRQMYLRSCRGGSCC